ncbi:hypothetical protein BV898_12138 [Hypsibius exemplaris]|uniref:Uncharacterized protein n=1 Tax=Hypsibius exemplaris TaxID=2072580 RepID=A0A1W0WEQ0_HYPEX|nr:hypothetical protein BV898_12138 [Hypsibius exemplaris]
MNAPYELYNEEHASAYMNDPVKRSSVAGGSNEYLNSYRLTPAGPVTVAAAPDPSLQSSRVAPCVLPALHKITPRCDGVATLSEPWQQQQ